MFDLQHLPGATEGERMVSLLRRHWITMSSLLFSLVIVLLLPLGVAAGLRLLQPTFFDDPVRVTLLMLGGSIFFLYALLFLYQSYIDYYLDTWVVTNRRVLDIEQHGLFSRTVSELRLYRIQDVTAEVKGFLHTMLDYGDVYIQTAGEVERFSFEDIYHPNQVAKIILDLSEKDRQDHLDEAVEEFGMPDRKVAAPVTKENAQ